MELRSFIRSTISEHESTIDVNNPRDFIGNHVHWLIIREGGGRERGVKIILNELTHTRYYSIFNNMQTINRVLSGNLYRKFFFNSDMFFSNAYYSTRHVPRGDGRQGRFNEGGKANLVIGQIFGFWTKSLGYWTIF